MARFNTALTSASISGTATIGSPGAGAFTNLTGTAPYTVTVPNPTLFPGVNQVFYNATSGTITLTTPSGNFNGTGGNGTASMSIFAGNVVSITSDGTHYIVISEDGSALTATTGSFSGNVTMNGSGATVSITPSTLTVTPSGASTIDNVAIGSTTSAAGAFTSLAANAAVTFTANTASSSTGTGTLVVTGGIGASGQVTATAVSATNITGTLQTAAQPNITSVGTLTSLGVGASPLANTKLTVTASSGSLATFQQTGATGYGLTVIPGADTTYDAFTINNAANSLNQIRMFGNGNATFAGSITAGKLDITNNSTYAITISGTGLIQDAPSGNNDHIATDRVRIGYMRGTNIGTIASNSADSGLSLVTHSSSTGWKESVRIQPSGNVGIGSTAPAYRLDVVAGDSGTGQMALANFRTGSSVASYNAGLQIYATGSATAASRSVIAVWDADGANASSGDYFIITKNGNSGATDILNYSNAAIRFGANYTGRATYDMTITSAGNVGIGTSSPVAKLHIGAEVEPNMSNQSLFVQGSKTGYAGIPGLPQNQLLVYDDTASTAGSGGAIGFGANTGSSQRTWIAAIESRRDSATNDATNYAGSLVFYTRPAQSPPEERMRISSAGNVGVATGAGPFSKLQVGTNTFSGGNGMYVDGRVGISNHGNLTGLMLASTYNDVWPEYGLVFVQGATTSNYNVWSLSPDGPARGSDLNFIYQLNSTNIHVATPTMRLQGSTGRLKVGTNNSSAINEPGIINVGAISNRDGRYVVGWWVGYTGGGTTYRHIKTSLWGGGSPYGNSDYIMGGFHIMGYYYSTPGQCDQWITFHNWSGSTQNGYNRSNAGNWTPDNAAYVGADGYVYIRLVSAGYMAYHIDLHQFPIYPVRNITVVSVTDSNALTI
jgi:hypothetical protein